VAEAYDNLLLLQCLLLSLPLQVFMPPTSMLSLLGFESTQVGSAA
jgi:hypothetical protein